uniref:Uncharacterized protein n=1 Tax=Arundo donax TaxID=35708 RepID=A0A0A9AEM3_ARUDO
MNLQKYITNYHFRIHGTSPIHYSLCPGFIDFSFIIFMRPNTTYS